MDRAEVPTIDDVPTMDRAEVPTIDDVPTIDLAEVPTIELGDTLLASKSPPAVGRIPTASII